MYVIYKVKLYRQEDVFHIKHFIFISYNFSFDYLLNLKYNQIERY